MPCDIGSAKLIDAERRREENHHIESKGRKMDLSDRCSKTQPCRELVRWAFAFVLVSASCLAADDVSNAKEPALSSEQKKEIEASIERALAWLAGQQKADGSFPTASAGEPAVSSLCLLAFMAAGHVPGNEPYGKTLDQGIDFVLACQRSDGLLALHRERRGHRDRLGHLKVREDRVVVRRGGAGGGRERGSRLRQAAHAIVLWGVVDFRGG